MEHYIINCAECGTEYVSELNETGLCPDCALQDKLEPIGFDE